jgi:aldose 1-epimerase
VTLEATVFPQTGYPFLLDTRVTYALTEEGPHRHPRDPERRADGCSGRPGHRTPTSGIGDVPSDDLVMRVAAETHIDVDERSNPVGETPVDGTPFDLRSGRPVSELDLDDGFGGVPVVDGRVEHSLTAP